MQLREGDTISCIICGHLVPEALVAREEGCVVFEPRFYLLQDEVNGALMDGLEKFPYVYSYVIGDGSDGALRVVHVKDIKILRRKKRLNHESEER